MSLSVFQSSKFNWQTSLHWVLTSKQLQLNCCRKPQKDLEQTAPRCCRLATVDRTISAIFECSPSFNSTFQGRGRGPKRAPDWLTEVMWTFLARLFARELSDATVPDTCSVWLWLEWLRHCFRQAKFICQCPGLRYHSIYELRGQWSPGTMWTSFNDVIRACRESAAGMDDQSDKYIHGRCPSQRPVTISVVSVAWTVQEMVERSNTVFTWSSPHCGLQQVSTIAPTTCSLITHRLCSHAEDVNPSRSRYQFRDPEEDERGLSGHLRVKTLPKEVTRWSKSCPSRHSNPGLPVTSPLR